ncbi:c-type cytochrome [Aromatoleum toluolicum]|uniref:Cytochrome c domain-containing protein n=1 Tax=Aromatoleum toluolicum TaxID=90060 RepID=A0ABX1NNL1_9RHOO|nr:c-type cytochrome [Aromatoleum toluolicum]NMG00822.1 c-type cytochrome [Aromatoleum toluolicum]
MNRHPSGLVVGIMRGLAATAVLVVPMSASADSEQARSQVWDIARGGQLYDDWGKVLGKELPDTTHPAYPASGKQKGSATWRCKECHGWDYKGADGAYGKGSHHTGIKGLRAMVGADPKAILKIISDDNHRYTEAMIGRGEMEKLALFVSLGQIDMDQHIDRATRKSRGEPGRGAPTYQTICAVCHGFDGKTLNFKTPETPEYVGTIARENPWEFMHKARFGQPGIPMISLITLPDTTLADLLAVAQTLPEK